MITNGSLTFFAVITMGVCLIQVKGRETICLSSL